MNKALKIIILLIILTLVFFANLNSAEEIKIDKTYAKKEIVTLRTISGDCIIKSGSSDKILVNLVYSYSPESFKPEFIEEQGELKLKEVFKGRTSSGSSKWTLTVPDTTEVVCRTISGDISVAGLAKKLIAKSTSGDIEVKNLSGIIELKSTSGDIEVIKAKGKILLKSISGEVQLNSLTGNVKVKAISGDINGENLSGEIYLTVVSGDVMVEKSIGAFNLKSVSGNIKGLDLTINKDSSFGVVSGDVLLKLAKSAKHNLRISSVSGDAELDYNGNPVTGFFRFSVKEGDGTISAPFKFDKVEKITKRDTVYLVKTVTIKNSTPNIKICTVSGEASLKK